MGTIYDHDRRMFRPTGPPRYQEMQTEDTEEEEEGGDGEGDGEGGGEEGEGYTGAGLRSTQKHWQATTTRRRRDETTIKLSDIYGKSGSWKDEVWEQFSLVRR